MLKKNDTYTINIKNVTAKGFGIGHVGDYVLFVDGGLPGDRLAVRVLKVKPRYGYGKIQRILRSSVHRIESPCPVSDRCGGCQWQHCDYQAQLGFKKDIVTDALVRIGGLSDVKVEDVIGMHVPQPYRNKAIFPVVPVGDEGFAIGMYAPRSHRIISVSMCAIQHPAHVPVLEVVREHMRQYKIKAYDETTHSGLMRYILVRTSLATDEIMVAMIINGSGLPKENKLAAALTSIRATTVLINRHETKGNAVMGDDFRILSGEGFIRERIGAIWYQLSPPSFFQINPVQTAVLYDVAIKMAGLTGSEIVMDAHVGVGGVALMAAGQAKEVIGVDIVEEAIMDAEKNAEINGIGNAREVLDAVAAGRSPYHFIEFMACPGGCVGGGGSPIRGDNVVRTESIYRSDANNPVRRSHENREVLKLYKEYLVEPCGEKSHRLLHTRYVDRSGEVKNTAP